MSVFRVAKPKHLEAESFLMSLTCRSDKDFVKDMSRALPAILFTSASTTSILALRLDIRAGQEPDCAPPLHRRSRDVSRGAAGRPLIPSGQTVPGFGFGSNSSIVPCLGAMSPTREDCPPVTIARRVTSTTL